MKKYFAITCIGFLLASCLGQDGSTGPSFEEQLKKDIATIDTYLSTNGISAVKDDGGARYIVTLDGGGQKPAANGLVYASYKTTVLSTGKLFFDSKDAFARVDLASPTLLSSWKAVLPKINKGSSLTIYSPSGLAYGTNSSSDGTLPSNSNIIFDIKLFNEAAFDSAMQVKNDTMAISSYLKSNSKTAIIHPTGIRYEITLAGTGANPTASSTVTFNYDGKFLATGATFDKSTTTPIAIPLTNIIKGLQIGFPLLSKGSKAIFYIPSSLGYGKYGSVGAIPSNSNLIFEVELVSFVN
jgi:FKBP-type peptidyl-prolyl cis-trans isomerase FkpA